MELETIKYLSKQDNDDQQANDDVHNQWIYQSVPFKESQIIRKEREAKIESGIVYNL